MKNIHIMGTGGSGASAVAAIAMSQGYQVTGCDLLSDSLYLEKLNLKVEKGHNPNHFKNVDHLVISPAILKLDPENREVIEAKKSKIPVLTWQQFMGKYLQKDKFVIAVSGTHGKSTTTAILGHILEDAGFDPTVELGAIDIDWKSNFRIGKSKYFVCEADEYNNNFLNYQPDIIALTNIEWDHPDFYRSEDAVFKSFLRFIRDNPKLKYLIINPKEPGIKKFVSQFKDKNKIINLANSNFQLKLPGNYNQSNANLAAAVAKSLGVEPLKLKKSIENFTGLERRFEYAGKFGKTSIYQDFAHHPTEVNALLQTAIDNFPAKKVWAIFQPHTYSRTKAFFDDFVEVFANSGLQKVIISPIFAAREQSDKSISSAKLAQEIGNKAQYIDSFKEIIKKVKSHNKEIDVLLVIGAGDIYKLSEELT